MPSRLTVLLVSLLLATPVLIFWLWLVIVPARVAELCPEECWCDTAGYYVECVGTSLNAVPLIYLTNVRYLSLERNNITLLHKDCFVSLSELEILTVFKSELRKIEVGAFNGLTKLRVLSIQRTEVSEIFKGTFENMKSLEYVSLWNNKLQHVDFDVFRELVNATYIGLTGNKLQYVHPDTFVWLPNLKTLYFGFNPDLQIPTDRNFIKSHSLSHLDISHCNVSAVSVETFANVSALKRLDLNGNELRTVDINILRALPNLSTLLLIDNPLQCDCQLQEVWRWCEVRNIDTVYRGVFRLRETEYASVVPQCDTPSEVEGMWWWVLEKGQCLEGNIQYHGDYNSTSYRDTDIVKYKYEHDNFFKQYQVPVYAVPFTFGTTGNVIILFIIICNKDMRTVPNMYILNLAISDIIYLTALFSEAVANKISRAQLEGDFMCIYLPFFRRMSVGLSAYSIALYSIQRYRVTINPIHIRLSSPPTWLSIVATFCGVWIVAALFAVPSAVSKNLCQEFVSVDRLTYYQRVVIFEVLVSCVLPLCVIAFTYIMTARHLVKSSRSISEGTQNPQLKTRRNTAKIVVGLTVVFVISYVPYHTFWTYFIWSKEDFFSPNLMYYSIYTSQKSYLISTCSLLINPCLNPVALFCTSSPFRQHLKRYLTCFCKTNPTPPIDIELARRN